MWLSPGAGGFWARSFPSLFLRYFLRLGRVNPALKLYLRGAIGEPLDLAGGCRCDLTESRGYKRMGQGQGGLLLLKLFERGDALG